MKQSTHKVLLIEVLKKVRKDKVVATHWNPDVGKKGAIEALRRGTGLEELKIMVTEEEKSQFVTLSSGIKDSIFRIENTIVIEARTNILSFLIESGYEEITGIHIPPQLVKYADKHIIPPINMYQSGFYLSSYAEAEQVWAMAEDRVMDQPLTLREAKKYGVAHILQEQKNVLKQIKLLSGV